jgi:signal transduction histidine kinase
MDAIPGLQAAEKVKIDLNAFSLYFTPNLLELDITQPYALQILDCTSDNRVIMRSGDLESLGEKVHISEIPIDDDSMFALRLIIKLPYGEFWGRMWVLLLSSIGSVILLSGILFYLLRTMFRQKTMDQMRRDFTHNITHELKTPISVAVAATDAMRNFSAEADVERRSRYLQIIETQLGQLGAMVERILSVSVEGRKERCHKEEILFFPMISSLTEEFSTTLAAKDGAAVPQFEIKCPKELKVWGDILHLKNIFSTLFENAVKYSDDTAQVRIVAVEEKGHCRITVKDKGRGIAREHQKHIFEKYYRVPQGDVQQVRGYGLGLYYARKAVELHGGTIDVSSRLGKGTEFTILLPEKV